MKKDDEMKNIYPLPVKVSKRLKEAVQELVKAGLFSSASEFAREAMEAYLVTLYVSLPEYEELERIVDEYLKKETQYPSFSALVAALFQDPRTKFSEDPVTLIALTRFIMSGLDSQTIREMLEAVFEKNPHLVFVKEQVEEKRKHKTTDDPPPEVTPNNSNSKEGSP